MINKNDIKNFEEFFEAATTSGAMPSMPGSSDPETLKTEEELTKIKKENAKKQLELEKRKKEQLDNQLKMK